MAQYKTKAERNFEGRFKAALELRDYEWLEKLFVQYGGFMELACDDEHFGDAEQVLIEWAPEKYDPIINLGDWEPPAFERETHVDRWCQELEWEFNQQKQKQWSAVKNLAKPNYYLSMD